MIRLGRALKSLLFARVSGAALLSKRAVIFSSGEATAQQLRNPLATGGVVLCGRKLVNNMDDSESKLVAEQPARSEGERTGEEGVGPSKKIDEEKQKSGLASTSPEGKEEEKEEGVPNEATSGTDSNEDSKMDDVEMAAEPSRETNETIIGEDKSKTDTKMTTATLEKDKTGNEVDKTPPPEEVDESTMTREDTSQIKDDKCQGQAGTHPQKQGGFGSFLTSQMASMKRWFSQEPKKDRQYYENLTLEEKRKLYKCGCDFVSLDDIPTWEEYRRKNLKPLKKQPVHSSYLPNANLNEKVSLWQGDITKLEIDAIVNAANSSLLGGGGVDGAIHRAAGYSLKDECATLGGCDTGDAKLTSGHKLPAKYVLHTVGPMNCSDSKLRSCYQHCLQLTLENGIRSVAFSCIATGVYGFPNKDAAEIALKTTREWLETNADKVDRIIFCVFLKVDREIYSNLLHHYFPADETDTDSDSDTKEPEVVVVEGSPADEPLPSPGDGGDAPTVPSLERSITEPVSTTGTSVSDSTVKPGPSAVAVEPTNTLKSEGTEETTDGEEGDEMEVSESCTSPNKKPKTE